MKVLSPHLPLLPARLAQNPLSFDYQFSPDVRFDIDLLRCIFCGFCEEACPEEAIELAEIYDFADYTRESFWIDKDGLLEVYDMTKDGNYYLSEKEDAS